MTLDMAWRIATVAAWFALLGVPRTAATHGQPPQVLLDAAGRLDRACENAGGRPARGAFLIAQDFSGDGVPDYLVNEGNYECSGRPNAFVEDKQAHVDIYVADGRGGATLVYRDRLLAVRVLDGRPHRVQVAQRGAGCGASSTAATECGGTLRWNARENAFDLELTGVRANPRAPMQRPAAGTLVARAGRVGEAPAGRDARVQAPATANAGTMKKFPADLFRSGYYVDADTPCEQASNATIALIGRAWYSGKIDWIRQKGPKDFEVHATGSFHGDEVEMQDVLRIESPTRISLLDPEHPGNARQKRYCPQRQLPYWQDADISDIDG